MVQAVWRKYPNPMNQSVVGIDIIDRKVCPETSVMRTHRLISCKWGLPSWAEKFLGRDTSYASEHSELDPKSRCFTLKSKNVSINLKIDHLQWLTLNLFLFSYRSVMKYQLLNN